MRTQLEQERKANGIALTAARKHNQRTNHLNSKYSEKRRELIELLN